MVMPKSYDAAVARKRLELRGEASAILVKGLTQACGDEANVTFKDGTLTIAPKRRGWPKGKKRGPKVK